MNDNNYVLLPQVKIGFIYNNIQTVVPFVLDESLDVYNLLKKLVDYCNELGARSNELQYILKDLVEFLNNKLNEQKDYINNFLENLHQEWLDYKDSLENRYDEFTTKVDELFETYKNQIRDEYNSELANIRTNNDTLYNALKTLLDNKITELTNYANSIEGNIDDYIDEKDQAIKELITNFQNEFTEYQKTVNNDLIELGDTLTELINTNEQNVIEQINTKTEEIVNTLGSVNMEELIGEKLNSYDSEELSDLFTNLYGSLIRITYMDTNTPPTVVSETPIYHYNPDTGVLTDCTTGNEVPLFNESLYLYEGRIFYPSFEANEVIVTQHGLHIGFNIAMTKIITRDEATGLLYMYNFDAKEWEELNINLPVADFPRSRNLRVIYDENKQILVVNNEHKCYIKTSSASNEITIDDADTSISSDKEKIYLYNNNKLYSFNEDYTNIVLLNDNLKTSAKHLCIIGKYNNNYIAYYNNTEVNYQVSNAFMLDNDYNFLKNINLYLTAANQVYVNLYNNCVNSNTACFYLPTEKRYPNLLTLVNGYAWFINSNNNLAYGYAILNNEEVSFQELGNFKSYYKECFYKYAGVHFAIDVTFTGYYEINSKLQEIPYQRSGS